MPLRTTRRVFLRRQRGGDNSRFGECNRRVEGPVGFGGRVSLQPRRGAIPAGDRTNRTPAGRNASRQSVGGRGCAHTCRCVLSRSRGGAELAAVRNVQPRPSVGFKFHAVLVVNSAHLASLSARDTDRWRPIFCGVDYFKDSQARDQREGNWTMGLWMSGRCHRRLKPIGCSWRRWRIGMNRRRTRP